MIARTFFGVILKFGFDSYSLCGIFVKRERSQFLCGPGSTLSKNKMEFSFFRGGVSWRNKMSHIEYMTYCKRRCRPGLIECRAHHGR